MKKSLILPISILVLALLGVGAYKLYAYYSFTPEQWENFQYQKGLEDKFACSYSAYQKINNGMSAEEVKSYLGEPTDVITKKHLSDYQFGLGDNEINIKSGWLYVLPPEWEGHLEVYFNTNNIVVGKNCGNG